MYSTILTAVFVNDKRENAINFLNKHGIQYEEWSNDQGSQEIRVVIDETDDEQTKTILEKYDITAKYLDYLIIWY